MIIVVMGVAGSGKTRVGRELAARLGWSFFDADDFHPAENIRLMSSGVPLTVAEREPWLESLRELVLRVDEEGSDAVLACSALGAAFRERLSAGIEGFRYVYLHATAELLARRLTERKGHFMPPDLLESQLAALEEPENELVLDASQQPDELIAQIRQSFGL